MSKQISDNKLLRSFYMNKLYDDEKFRFVKYPNVIKYRYVISNHGRVFKFTSGKEKKYYADKDGYLKTSIIKNDPNGNRLKRNVFVHRLVASTFIDNDDSEKYMVNHKDGNKSNNYYKNLEWVSPAENTQHAISIGLQCNSGISCPSAKYSEKMIRYICEMIENGYTTFDIYKSITNDDHIIDKAIYALIYTIQNKTRHIEISSEYNFPNTPITTKQKFTQDEILKFTELIDLGYTNIDIVKYFGGTTVNDKFGRRISDKVTSIRNKRSTTIEKII